MSDVTLADLAARRKALAEMALGIAHGFAPRYRGLHDECLPAVESALVQAQRDLCEVLKAEVWALQGRYSTDDSHTCPWVERSRIVALLDRALDGEPPAPKEGEQ